MIEKKHPEHRPGKTVNVSYAWTTLKPETLQPTTCNLKLNSPNLKLCNLKPETQFAQPETLKPTRVAYRVTAMSKSDWVMMCT